MNGTFRGKRIAVDDLKGLSGGCYFPQSVYSVDWEGKVLSKAADDVMLSEPDRLCLPVAGTLRPSAHGPDENAQLLLTMKDNGGKPYALEPRAILENVLHELHDRGYFPVVAPELEFYLIDHQAQDARGRGSFHMAVPSAYSAFIEKLERAAEAQNLPLTGLVSEAEPGQFELNLKHSHHVLQVCENALALRRLTSIVAEESGFKANFMAKPFSDLAGNGLHFHISLNDIHGDNVFASAPDELNETMKLCLLGLLDLMPASIAIMAPHVNSYRRMRKSLDEPFLSSWGYNMRSAALRIPCSKEESRRIEYRLAGSDANPYLVMATILSGFLYGLEHINDCELDHSVLNDPAIPLFQKPAIELFEKNACLREHLGEAFCEQWVHSKLAELSWFESQVSVNEFEY
jgi:gamma-glutamylputrescine synthase